MAGIAFAFAFQQAGVPTDVTGLFVVILWLATLAVSALGVGTFSALAAGSHPGRRIAVIVVSFLGLGLAVGVAFQRLRVASCGIGTGPQPGWCYESSQSSPLPLILLASAAPGVTALFFEVIPLIAMSLTRRGERPEASGGDDEG